MEVFSSSLFWGNFVKNVEDASTKVSKPFVFLSGFWGLTQVAWWPLIFPDQSSRSSCCSQVTVRKRQNTTTTKHQRETGRIKCDRASSYQRICDIALDTFMNYQFSEETWNLSHYVIYLIFRHKGTINNPHLTWCPRQATLLFVFQNKKSNSEDCPPIMPSLPKLVFSLHILVLPSFSEHSRDTYKVRSCFRVHVWFSSLWKSLLKQVRTVSGKETVVEVARKTRPSKMGI